MTIISGYDIDIYSSHHDIADKLNGSESCEDGLTQFTALGDSKEKDTSFAEDSE